MFTFQDCCYKCEKLDIRYKKLSFGGQKDCGDGKWPNLNGTDCETLERETLNPSAPLSIFALGLATFGIVLTLGFTTFGFYYRLIILDR